MKISAEETRRIASLARLRCTEEEVGALQADMEQIITFANKLSELDLTDVPPTISALPISNAFREDEVQPSLDRERVLMNAPKSNGRFILVPKVIE